MRFVSGGFERRATLNLVHLDLHTSKITPADRAPVQFVLCGFFSGRGRQDPRPRAPRGRVHLRTPRRTRRARRGRGTGAQPRGCNVLRFKCSAWLPAPRPGGVQCHCGDHRVNPAISAISRLCFILRSEAGTIRTTAAAETWGFALSAPPGAGAGVGASTRFPILYRR